MRSWNPSSGCRLPTRIRSEAPFSYLQCLREASTPDRFFHRSLEIDPVNVARTLLDWREQWYEAGWDGTFSDDAPRRLVDMAAIEAVSKSRVPPTHGERLQRVAETLTERRTQIERVELQTTNESRGGRVLTPWKIISNGLNTIAGPCRRLVVVATHATTVFVLVGKPRPVSPTHGISFAKQSPSFGRDFHRAVFRRFVVQRNDFIVQPPPGINSGISDTPAGRIYRPRSHDFLVV